MASSSKLLTPYYEDVLDLSDTHAGNIFGLLPPGYQTSSGNIVELNIGQHHLWNCFMHFADKIKKATEAGLLNVKAIVMGGDMVDGKQRLQWGTEAVFTNPVDQADAFEMVVRIFMERAGIIHVPIYGLQGCLTEGHRVLTSDLKWVPVEDLSVGQAILTVEETPRRAGRNWAIGAVTAHVPVTKEVCEVTLEDGRKIVCTTDHPFLVYNRSTYVWTQAAMLRRSSRVVLMVSPWERLSSYQAGWVAGLLEGEGTIQQKGVVEFGQKPGVVLDRAVETLGELGYDVAQYHQRDIVCGHILGGARASMKLLGETGPDRMIGRFLHKVGKARAEGMLRVVSVRPLGRREVVGLSTSTGTYVADGLVHHNTEYHDDKAATEAERIYKALGATPYAGLGSGHYSREILDLEVLGININFVHGISVSSGLYRATAPDREGIWSALAGRDGKMPPAPVVVRHHAHYFVHVEHASKHILINPCWELQTRYMRKHGGYRMIPDLGSTIIRVYKEAWDNDDRVQIKKFLYPLPGYSPTKLQAVRDARAAEATREWADYWQRIRDRENLKDSPDSGRPESLPNPASR